MASHIDVHREGSSHAAEDRLRCVSQFTHRTGQRCASPSFIGISGQFEQPGLSSSVHSPRFPEMTSRFAKQGDGRKVGGLE
jgi:hypothetical protein